MQLSRPTPRRRRSQECRSARATRACGFPRGDDRRAGLLGAADLCGSRCHTYHFFTDCIVKRDPCQSAGRGPPRPRGAAETAGSGRRADPDAPGSAGEINPGPAQSAPWGGGAGEGAVSFDQEPIDGDERRSGRDHKSTRRSRRGCARMRHGPMRQADIERGSNLAKARRCGARTRAGHPCRQAAVMDRARCRMHGCDTLCRGKFALQGVDPLIFLEAH